MGSEFSWDVMLPQRGAGLGQAPPRATLLINAPATGSERLSLPVAVARSLARMQKSGELLPRNAPELKEALGIVTRRVAHERVLKMLERRDYSDHEAYSKLRQEGYSESVARQAVARAVETGLISNERFALAFVRGKVSAGWGMGRIERELSRRGIEARELEGWPYDYLDPDDEYERAVQVATRKRVREPHAYAKLVRFLMGRGFSYGVASSAARNTLQG